MILSLDIWAFVRVMVQLEDGGAHDGPLFLAWGDDWAEVDASLADLAQSDFDAYSDMMMETQIDLELPEALQADFLKTVRSAIETLKGKRDGADADMRKDLKFEIEGLYALRDQVA